MGECNNYRYLNCHTYAYMFFMFQASVSYSLLGAGWVLLTFVIYFVTLEQLFMLPFVFIVFVVCFAFLLELFLHPTRSLFNRFRSILGPKQFLWMLRIGAVLLIAVWSTQSYISSFILLTIICAIIKQLSKRFQRSRRRQRS